jgi:aryl-alcohol dehydrogenase-like predicted oxidoreductase
MGMSFAYSTGGSEESVDVLRRSLELGSNFWDTADMYGAGENEKLLSQVLKDHRDEVFLATKFANVFDRTLTSHQDQVEANVPHIVDGTPVYVQKSCERSLQRLGVDVIDLYYQHRVDRTVPIEETVGAMAELVKQGKVRYLGLSEASAETIRRAHRIHPITALQSEYSLWTRDYEEDVIPLCRELGITFVPYSPLGRGFLTGEIKSIDDLAPDDWRRTNPRFQGENFNQNFRLVDAVTRVAERRGVKPSQVALAWVLAQGENLVPIPGTKRLRYLEENVAAADVELAPEDLAELAEIEAPSGTRYAETAMAMLNA